MNLICRDATGVGVWALASCASEHTTGGEIQVPSKAKKKLGTTLVEVCWTRSIPVSARVKMHLAGSRFLFELPAPGQSPQAH
jgi:hypothetical protein